jgi:hypothetical protein
MLAHESEVVCMLCTLSRHVEAPPLIGERCACAALPLQAANTRIVCPAGFAPDSHIRNGAMQRPGELLQNMLQLAQLGQVASGLSLKCMSVM